MLRLVPIVLLAGSAFLVVSHHTLAAPLYEIRDAQGNVTYTDQPPADGARGASKKIEQKPLNVLESTPGTDYQKSFGENIEQRQQQRDSAWQQYDGRLKEAEEKLKSAQRAQKEGTVMQEGDMIATANGRNTSMRPSEEYLGRQQMLEQAVKEAEANLRAVKKQKPQLHR